MTSLPSLITEAKQAADGDKQGPLIMRLVAGMEQQGALLADAMTLLKKHCRPRRNPWLSRNECPECEQFVTEHKPDCRYASVMVRYAELAFTPEPAAALAAEEPRTQWYKHKTIAWQYYVRRTGSAIDLVYHDGRVEEAGYEWDADHDGYVANGWWLPIPDPFAREGEAVGEQEGVEWPTESGAWQREGRRLWFGHDTTRINNLGPVKEWDGAQWGRLLHFGFGFGNWRRVTPAADTVERLKGELLKAKQEIGATRCLLNTYDDRTPLNEQVDACAKKLLAENGDLQSQLTASQSENAQLKERVAELETCMALQKGTHASAIAANGVHVAQLTAERDALAERVNGLEAEANESEHVKLNVSELLKEVAQGYRLFADDRTDQRRKTYHTACYCVTKLTGELYPPALIAASPVH